MGIKDPMSRGQVIFLLALVVLTSTPHVFSALKVGDDFSKINWRAALAARDTVVVDHIQNSVLINTDTPFGPGRGTGFYLGRHFGKHLFMTNAHILTPAQCRTASVTYLKSNQSIGRSHCDEVLLHRYVEAQSDVTLFTIKANDLKNIAGKGLQIDFTLPATGALLAQFGFGVRRLGAQSRDPIGDQFKFLGYYTMDSDCAQIARSGDLRTIVAEHGRRVRHSTAIGCDVSSGDSGSAVIDRHSGRVVAILWGAGHTSSGSKEISSEMIWAEILGTNDPRVWENFAFVIPMAKLEDELKPFLEF